MTINPRRITVFVCDILQFWDNHPEAGFSPVDMCLPEYLDIDSVFKMYLW